MRAGATEPTDIELVNAIRSGDEARVNGAVRCLYRHKAYVTSFVRTDDQRELLQFDQHFVNDLFQETVVTFLEKVWAYQYEPRETAGLRSYLYKMCKLKYLTERRNTLTRLGYEQDFSLYEADEPSTGEEILLEKERFEIAENLFNQIDNQGGELIRMFDFQGKSHREMAEILKITEAAAKQRYHRARLRLAALLNKYSYGTT